ncbi:MAG: hypothetical protein OEL20_01970 [Sulfuritalea sp.]|nr:hypothetical protein [Sulfuritalea sp.]
MNMTLGLTESDEVDASGLSAMSVTAPWDGTWSRQAISRPMADFLNSVFMAMTPSTS